MINKKWKTGVALVMALAMVPVSVPVKAQTLNKSVQLVDSSRTSASSEKEYAEGEAVILYKSGTAKANLFSKSNGLGSDMEITQTYDFDNNASKATSESNSISESGISISLVKSEKYSTKELIKILEKRSDIQCAEPNYKIKAMDVGDPYKKYQWTLENTGQNGGTVGYDVNPDIAALNNDGDDNEKVIAIVDTGIDYTHDELKNVVWNNPINSRQLRGTHGYDFINMDGDPLDDNGHGTHCSGIMAASSNNGIGISGVAKSSNIKIMGLKILDEEGYGYGMEAVGAYNYIYKAQQLGVNVVAVNNSWGASVSDDGEDDANILLKVINMVGDKGALSVCAAGNEASDNDMGQTVPTNLDSQYIISVAASNENDELAGFSNYGSTSVDIAAPGANILSTVSYNTFNPILYDNKDEMCSLYEEFESGKNLVKTLENNETTGNIAGENDISYGLDSGNGTGNVSVDISEDEYFGEASPESKSMNWNVTDAKEGEMYTLYLPYTAFKSDTPLYSSVMVKASGPSGTGESAWGSESSVVVVSDGTVSDSGSYDSDSSSMINGAYVNKGNYWSSLTGKVAENVTVNQQNRAVALQLYPAVDGDYTVYIDNMGVSKSGVKEETFGKYDFYNGTSMATPCVTGAVAAVANSFSDETALERKARILGSTRKSEMLDGMVSTGGVLDLSKVEAPNMSLSTAVLNDNKQIELYGYYLNDAQVSINGKDVTPIEQTEYTVTLDGSDYLNKSITVELTKGSDSYTAHYFFTSGKKFNGVTKVEGNLNGGEAVSDGQRLYYINDSGNVFIGTPNNGTEKFSWDDTGYEYSLDIFDDSYSTARDYILSSITDVACVNKKLYAVLSLDVGYSEESVLACFDEEKGWQKYSDIPEEFIGLSGITLGSYDGQLYLMGGFDDSKGKCSKQVMCFDNADNEWNDGVSLPDGRCFAKAYQVGDKLIMTLGGTGTDNYPRTLIFNGETWSRSKVLLDNVIDPDLYAYETDDCIEMFPILLAQTGPIKNGIIYTGIQVEGLGDTFTYDVTEDKYISSGYALNTKSLNGDYVMATTIQNSLYALSGLSANVIEDDFGFLKNQISSSDDFSDESADYIDIYEIPVESGFVHVSDKSETGATIAGAGYYLPGDTIQLTANADKDYKIKSFTVNGETVNADAKGIYSYTFKAQGTVCDIQAVAKAETTVKGNSTDNTDGNTTSGKNSLPVKNSKATVGNAIYKVVKSDAKDGTVVYTALNNKKTTKAKVPSTVKINGYTFKVVKIDDRAFKNCKKLKTVTVGSNVTSIGKNAWKGCTKLKKVTIKSSKIKTFGKGLFSGAYKKVTVKVPAKSKKAYISKLKKVGFKGKIK